MKTEVQGNSANRPVKSFRCGNFSGAIWANEKQMPEGMVSFLTASLRRSWKDKSGSWRDETVNLRKNDIAKAVLLLNKLQEEMFFSDTGSEQNLRSGPSFVDSEGDEND